MKDIKVKKRIRESSHQLGSVFNDDPILNSILCARGVSSSDELDLSIKGLLHPNQMAGLQEAAKVLQDAIVKCEKILIVGDFDVDGATSTALMLRVLKKFGVERVDYLVPNRFNYGYGLSPEFVEFAAKKKSPELIITVDNGISSLEGVSIARGLNIKVLITDHHLPGEIVPDADAILNPVLDKKNHKYKNLAGVGVAFYLLAQTRILLTKCGWFDQNRIKPPKLSSYLDLVALGTIADLVPLDCNNRRLVFNGLRLIKAKLGNPGIIALANVSGKSLSFVNESDLAFSIAPKINAAGRLADMSIGIECLISDDYSYCTSLAESLNEINQRRKKVEEKIQEEALKIAADITGKFKKDQIPSGFALFGTGWHQGVSGIVASRVKEAFNRPVIVFANDKEGVLKGSARSVTGVHIRDVLSYVNSTWPGIIIQFGGHAMAAGLSIRSNDLKDFGNRFNIALSRLYGKSYFDEVLYTDGELTEGQYGITFFKKLEELGPWGNGFPEPKFDGKFDIIDQKLLSGGHIRMVLKPLGMEATVEAIAFGAKDSAWVKSAKSFFGVFRLQVNRFRNVEKAQLVMDKIIEFT
tara:strand:+ start:365 stop:2110 length:1746 start_codon:yes stop_codon:yes gene_type:complete